jgi:hypothetical protein
VTSARCVVAFAVGGLIALTGLSSTGASASQLHVQGGTLVQVLSYAHVVQVDDDDKVPQPEKGGLDGAAPVAPDAASSSAQPQPTATSPVDAGARSEAAKVTDTQPSCGTDDDSPPCASDDQFAQDNVAGHDTSHGGDGIQDTWSAASD